MRIPWTLVQQILLSLVAIYLVGGAIVFTLQLLQAFELATPITLGCAALLVAAIAKLIIREDLWAASPLALTCRCRGSALSRDGRDPFADTRGQVRVGSFGNIWLAAAMSALHLDSQHR